MRVADVMERGVISIAPDESVEKAARLMLQYDLSGLPVLDHGRLVGMITEGDFLRRAETDTERRRPRWAELFIGPARLAEEYTHAHGRTVSEVMTPDVVTVGEDAGLEEAVALMEQRHIKRLPVVRGGVVVGLLTRSNLLHAFIAKLPRPSNSGVDDAEIRDRLIAELKGEFWFPRGAIDISVEDGVVALHGIVRDQRQRHAVRVAAENIEGVKQVRDELVELDQQQSPL